jgi:hypothetical protein
METSDFKSVAPIPLTEWRESRRQHRPGTRRNIGLQRVEANRLALSTRFFVDAVTLNRRNSPIWGSDY